MSFWGIFSVIILAALVTSIFAFVFNMRGPWGALWAFFLILILGLWTVALWIPPIGPVWYGVAWLDLTVVALLVALVLAAATPAGRTRTGNETAGEVNATATIGTFFWMLLIAFFILIVAGFVRYYYSGR